MAVAEFSLRVVQPVVLYAYGADWREFVSH